MAGSHSAKGSKVRTGGAGGRGATEAKARSLEGRLPDLPGHGFQNTAFPGCGGCVLLFSISPGLGTGSGTQRRSIMDVAYIICYPNWDALRVKGQLGQEVSAGPSQVRLDVGH